MNGRYAGSAGIDPERVAVLRVTHARSGTGRRGSGYQVSASAVLTAEHVVRDAGAVEVRFNADRPDEWVTEGNVVWSDPDVDAAVIVITPRPQDERQVVPAQFGRVPERDVELESSVMGFPRYKLRYDRASPRDGGRRSQYRDSAHAIGKIAVLANQREGTLEVLVAPPDPDPDPRRSPWEGMSGAAVWSGGRIIGLVAEHHRSDGLNRLAAIRVDRWYERLAPEQLEKLRSLLPQLPDHLDGLVNVAERPGEPTQFRDTGSALSPDVQDAYRRVFTDTPISIGSPVSWTLTELSGLQREVAAAAQGASEVADTLTALCEALEAKPVFITIGGRSLELDQLQVTYRREIEAWPGGGSADALLVEAASAGIVERRDKPDRSLGSLARFVVGIAARLGVAPDENDSLREWIGSLGHQLADAQQHYLERREDPAWLLIDLGDEPLPGKVSWPTKVMWTRVAPDGPPLTGDPIICEANQDDLKRALSEVLRLAPPARPLLVDLAVPRALMDLGIEHWEIVEVDGVAEPLSVDYRPRLRWSKRRHDERLFNRVCTRLENASWKGGPKQWLENNPRHACFVGWADVRPSPADTLRTVLRDGCAFVIWFRASLPDSALREITRAIRKMPVQARRRNLPDYLPVFSQGHPVIIWDDPRGRGDFRLPPIVKPQSP